MKPAFHRRIHQWALGAFLGMQAVVAQAGDGVPPGPVTNPLRGRADVLAAGQAAFESRCAACHGHEASQVTPEGPDLRRLDTFCRKLHDSALRQHCVRDVDTYYFRSVLEGKVRAGVRYMPAWQNELSEETIWSIKTYIESRPPPGRLAPSSP